MGAVFPGISEFPLNKPPEYPCSGDMAKDVLDVLKWFNENPDHEPTDFADATKMIDDIKTHYNPPDK